MREDDMTTQLIIRIDAEMKTKLSKLAQADGKNASQVIRELIDNYVQERDIGAYIDDLWNRTGKKLAARGVSLADVEQTIREVRKGKR
jgi:predicted DNA-binding protein